MGAVLFSQTGTADGSYTETSTEFWAQSFTLGGSAFTLSSVDVFLTAGSPSSQFFVALYSNNTGTPGSLLETLSGSNNPVTSGTYTYTSTGSLLSANTTYWIVQGISSGGGFQYWNENNTGTPQVGSSIGVYYTTNSGGTWNSQPAHTMQMVVNGATVPEPSTWAILAGGTVFLLAYRRR